MGGRGKKDIDIRSGADVARWVEKGAALGFDVHAWCVLRGQDADMEANLVAEVCNVPGLKSMVLDVEVGADYFLGGVQAVKRFGTKVREEISDNFHLGLCLDARGNHPRDIHIGEWLPFVQSLHPMVYHKDFGEQPEAAITRTFAKLAQYQKPIIPMLQGYGLEAHEHTDILVAANKAIQDFNATGISIFRLGSLVDADCDSISRIDLPDVETVVVIGTFDFTCQQLKDAFISVAARLGLNVADLLASAGLTNLDQRLTQKYVGVPIQDLPGLTENIKDVIEALVNGEGLPDNSGDINGRVTNQQIINAFYRAARALGQVDQYWNWIVQAGLAHIAASEELRNALYNGPRIEALPNLSAEIVHAIMVELDLALPIGTTTILPVPWVSQVDIRKFNACGPASVLMVGLAYGDSSVNTLEEMDPILSINRITSRPELITAAAASAEVTLLDVQQRASLGMTGSIRAELALRRPVIVLLDYRKLTQAPFNNNPNVSAGTHAVGHWWVIVGTEGDNFVVNDPLWASNANNGQGGRQLRVSEMILGQAMIYGLVAIAPSKPLP